jgi:hypothetical protein
MGEKRGFTGKLKFDFDPTAVLEVSYSDNDRWFRVTAETFRSFDGLRRVLNWTPVKRGMHSETIITQYDGPLYLWGTNTEVEKAGTEKVVSSPQLVSILKASRKALQRWE